MSDSLPAPVSLLVRAAGSGVVLPYARRVRLIETAVAGTGHAGVEYFAAELRAGSRAALVREPGNAHDARAIAVRDDRGRKLGYVPRACNEILAALLDAGKRLEATLTATEAGTMWPELRIAVELVDE